MRELVSYLAKSLVDEPDRVTVDELDAGRTRVYEVRVAPGDVGKLIGRAGRTVKALRRVVASVARAQGHRVELEVLADDE